MPAILETKTGPFNGRRAADGMLRSGRTTQIDAGLAGLVQMRLSVHFAVGKTGDSQAPAAAAPGQM
jgi:hypothetical protein